MGERALHPSMAMIATGVPYLADEANDLRGDSYFPEPGRLARTIRMPSCDASCSLNFAWMTRVRAVRLP